MMSCYLTYFIVDLIETLNLEEARIGPLLGSGCKHIPMCNLPLLLIDNGGFMLMNSDFFETLLWALTIIHISCQVVYLLWLEGYGLPIGVGHNPKYTRCNDTRHDVVAMLVCSDSRPRACSLVLSHWGPPTRFVSLREEYRGWDIWRVLHLNHDGEVSISLTCCLVKNGHPSRGYSPEYNV